MRLYRSPSLRVSAILLVAALWTGGCLVTSHSDERHSGNYVSDETLRQIEPGKTRASWVHATLGQPTSVDRLDDGTELWKYSYTEHKDSSGAVFLIFAGDNSKETHRTVFVEVKNDVVTKTWRG